MYAGVDEACAKIRRVPLHLLLLVRHLQVANLPGHRDQVVLQEMAGHQFWWTVNLLHGHVSLRLCHWNGFNNSGDNVFECPIAKRNHNFRDYNRDRHHTDRAHFLHLPGDAQHGAGNSWNCRKEENKTKTKPSHAHTSLSLPSLARFIKFTALGESSQPV